MFVRWCFVRGASVQSGRNEKKKRKVKYKYVSYMIYCNKIEMNVGWWHSPDHLRNEYVGHRKYKTHIFSDMQGKVLCGWLVVPQPKNCRPLIGNNHMNYQSHTRPISLLKFYFWNTEESAYMNPGQKPWESEQCVLKCLLLIVRPCYVAWGVDGVRY